jgi:hypothetical protein
MNRDTNFLNGQANGIFSIEMMLKATPAMEGDRRFIYLEASTEKRDLQGEMVLAKALEASADHYLKFGNIDIDHKSMPAVAAMYGIEKPALWEIGSPVDVRIDGASTFVKAELLRGDTPLAENANEVWDSMTKLRPARKWYPSVGGKILAKSAEIDPKSGDKVGVVSAVRWTNVAISQQPVNQHVGGITTIPYGILAKSLAADGTFDFAKALEASYATDAAGKTGGAAFGMQSLDTGGGLPHSYFDFREMLSKAINKRLVPSKSQEGLMDYAVSHFSLSHDEAAEWVVRFLGDLQKRLSNKPHRSKQ